MQRFKNFDATGIAPNGDLYAGDLNQLQDLAAALSDFAQNIQLGSIAVGEAGLQLLHYGTGEARLTGALRTDGILRGLSGLYGGTFTSTQRDAIPAGSRPTGLQIYNSTTLRYEQNVGTDAVPNWVGMGRGIVDGDIAAAAGIQRSKLGALNIVNADIAAGAGIGITKLTGAYAYGGSSSGVNQNSPSAWIWLLPGGFTLKNITTTFQSGVTQLLPQIAGVYVCWAGYDARGSNVGTGPMQLIKNSDQNQRFGAGAYANSGGIAVGANYFNGTSDFWGAQFFQTSGSQVPADANNVGCALISAL